MIYHGNNSVQRVFVGEQEAPEVYRGRDLIWSRRLGGMWRYEFEERGGVYDAHTYAAENGRGRLSVEHTSFPFSVASGYPGLVFMTANPVQVTSHTVMVLHSGLLAPPVGDDILLEVELFMNGNDAGAWEFGLFGNSIGLVFDRTGLEINMAPRLWAGRNETKLPLHGAADDSEVGGRKGGHVGLWISPKNGWVRAYLGKQFIKELTLDKSTLRADVPLDFRFANRAAFFISPIGPFTPVPVPVFPPGIHAVQQSTGIMAFRRAHQLGWTEGYVEPPPEPTPETDTPIVEADDSLSLQVEYTVKGPWRVEVPQWARSVEVVALGGGGGGSGGDIIGANACNGGDAGQWAAGTFTNLPSTLSIYVGGGGDPGASTKGGYEGEASWVRTGSGEVKALPGGGGQGYGDPSGRSPGNREFFGRQFIGGKAVGQTVRGDSPGGGGGAASTKPIGRTLGGAGGTGKIWLKFSSNETPGP